MKNSQPLIQALQDPACYDHPVQDIQVIETHISWVLLSGPYAYKIKKPLNLGFLDFSTLKKRHHYCHEELRLNSRLAPDIYLDVVNITADALHPQINGTGEAIEYAIRMKQFPQQAQLDRVLAEGKLEARHMDIIAEKIAYFHAHIDHADDSSDFGRPEGIKARCMGNFDLIETHIKEDSDIRSLEALRQWTDTQFHRLHDEMMSRKANGFIRECHGDLHLRNMALIDDNILIFDCIEFNDDFRWIDVISEIAFTVMDLQDRGHGKLAYRFLNRYLEITGDYSGLTLLPYYLLYRAMVRAKVDCIRAFQDGIPDKERQSILEEYRSYIRLAEIYTRPQTAALFITHGLSGSGKTFFTQSILEHLPAIRIRSDIERKRLFDIETNSNTNAGVQDGIYSLDASRQTYNRLAELARVPLNAGYHTIVDATFLRCEQRQQFRDLAEQLGIPFVILDFHAIENILRERIIARQAVGKDASEADIEVLEQQMASIELFSEDEIIHCITIDTMAPFDITDFLRRLAQQLAP